VPRRADDVNHERGTGLSSVALAKEERAQPLSPTPFPPVAAGADRGPLGSRPAAVNGQLVPTRATGG
jgi:hypothetical protein